MLTNEERDQVRKNLELVWAECQAQGLIPLVMLAGSSETKKLFIVPMGPGMAPEDVRQVLILASASGWENEKPKSQEGK